MKQIFLRLFYVVIVAAGVFLAGTIGAAIHPVIAILMGLGGFIGTTLFVVPYLSNRLER